MSRIANRSRKLFDRCRILNHDETGVSPKKGSISIRNGFIIIIVNWRLLIIITFSVRSKQQPL